MLILKESDVHNLLTLNEAIQVNEQVFLKESKGEVFCPDRIIIPVEKKEEQNNCSTNLIGNLYFKPSLINNESIGLKIVAGYPKNSEKQLPTVPATIVLNDIETGIVNCVIGATYITGARTAAGSALAVKYLLQPEISPNSLFVFGCAIQAKLHIEMIILLKPTIKKVSISARTSSNVDKMIQEIKNNKEIETNDIEFIYYSPNDINSSNSDLKEADIIVTATSANEPLFNGKEILGDRVKPILITSVGSSRPTNRELDSFTICNSNLIVDDINSTMVSGELAIPIEKEHSITKQHIAAKLCDVVSGNYKLNNSSSLITVYKSSGTAIQDVATAYYIYKKACSKNVGINIDM